MHAASKEFLMKKTCLFAAAAVLLLGSAATGLAQTKGISGSTPGHQLQESGRKGDAPGASGYAPGHNKDADDVKSNRGTAPAIATPTTSG